jgi:hypothetical protein
MTYSGSKTIDWFKRLFEKFRRVWPPLIEGRAFQQMRLWSVCVRNIIFHGDNELLDTTH